MKKYFLLALSLVLISIAFAGTYTIGTGTSGSYAVPFNGLLDNNWSKSIYTKDEINAAGLTAANTLIGIAFDVTSTPRHYTMLDQRVYVRHTSAAAYGETDIEHPNSVDFDAVFQGDLTYNGSGWFGIVFSTPFAWDGNSNLEFLFESHNGSYSNGNPYFAYTSTSPDYRTVHKSQNDSFPQGVDGSRVYDRPNIQLYTTMDEPPAPAPILSPADGATLVSMAATLNWNPVIGADGYKLYFGDTNPPAYIGDLGNVTTYNPNVLDDETLYYWQVVPYNTYGDAVNCPVWGFTTTSAGSVIIGDGAVTNIYLPVNTLSTYSYSQTIYLQEEINAVDQRIEKISYYWDGARVGTNNDGWTVFMGHTDNDSFASTSDWIPLNDLTQVYSGILDIPAIEGWITIDLADYFIYNNSQNLVIAVLEDSPGFTYGGSFLNTVAAGRSLRCQQDSTVPNPASPPTGIIQGHFPNIVMEFGDLPVNPVLSYTPTALDFGVLFQNAPSDWQNVTVTNIGAGTLNLSTNDISFVGTDATMFEFDAVNLPAALQPGVSVNIPVRAILTAGGDISATLRMVHNATNYDVALSAVGFPDGTYVVGEGSATSRFPLGSWYGYERSAALYPALELGAGNRRINTLGWFPTEMMDAAVPTKIYLKKYTGSTMTANTWANMIAGATTVYDDTITSIEANEWYTVTLDTTFDLDSGDNLLVLVERNFGGGGGSTSYWAPSIYATTMNNAHLTWDRDNSPPTGTSSAQTTRPNLMMFADSYTTTTPPNPVIVESPADQATDIPLTATLDWMSGGGAPTGYKLYFGNTMPPAYIGDLGFVLSYDPSLTWDTTYYWQVVPYNSNGDATNCPIWSFSTMADPTVMLPVTFDFTGEVIDAMPTGWESSHTNWNLVPSSNAGGSAPELELDYYPEVDDNVRAITPPLYGDNEGGYTLKFKHTLHYFPYGDPYTLKVEASTDKVNWTTLWSMDPTDDVIEAEVEVPNNLDAYLEAPFYLAWTFDGNTYDIDNWFVDDISIVPIVTGAAAVPLLTYPDNGASGLPLEGFNLTWEPDLLTGGEPDYYVVFMSQDEDELYDDYFETENTYFNPVTEAGIIFDYNERWFWAVEAQNQDGGNVSDTYFFTTIGHPAQISVSPTSFTETLEVGDSSVQVFTITNDGGQPLQYSIGFAETEGRGVYAPVISNILPNPNAALYAEKAPHTSQQSYDTIRAYLDLQFAYPNADANGEYGVASDGEFIYTSKWNGSGNQTFFKYSLDGDYLGSFDIPGFAGVRDMTYDGTYFYGSTGTTTIYVMDFDNLSLVRTIIAPAAARGIAYDADRDGLWITNNFSSPLRLINMDGAQLELLDTAASSMTGIAYDAISGDGTIWANTQSGEYTSNLIQIDVETGDILSTININPTLVPGIDDTSLGGGIDITTGIVPGYATILANTQNNVIYGLELCSMVTWANADPRSGIVPAGSSVEVDVIFDANNIAPGTYTGSFTIAHNAEDQDVEIPTTLTITGDWLPVFSIDLESWDFGEVEQLNPASKGFTIKNIGGPGLTFTPGDIYIADDIEGNFQIQANLPVELEFNQRFGFDVVFTPQTLGAKTANLKIQDNLGRVVHTYPLSGTGIDEAVGQVVSLQANVQNITDVLLSWGLASSTPGTPGWLHYDNGFNDDGIGTGGVVNFDVAIKFTSADLWNYSAMQIEKVKFFPRSENTDYTLKIWTGSDASLAPSTLMYSQPITNVTKDVWNEVVLATPFTIAHGDAIWIGYNCDVNAGEDMYPAGCDAGPAVVGKGDLIEMGGSWFSARVQYNLDVNWNLQAYVNDSVAPIRGTWLNTPVITKAQSKADRNSPIMRKSGNTTAQQRVLRGFNVYRNNVQINTDLVPSPIYLDAGLPNGTYTYTVQAVYHSQLSNMSDPATAIIDAPTPLALPFIEGWDAEDFDANLWSVEGANWLIDDSFGYPAPSAVYDWSPIQQNYEHFLTSYRIDATGIDNVYMGFNLHVRSYDDNTDNYMFWEVWDGTEWVTIGGYNAAFGDLNWATVLVDISEHAANRVFQIRFVATGEDTNSIWEWGVDNIKVAELPATVDPITDLSVETTETGDFLLSWTENPVADWYMIYIADDPYGDYEALGFIDAITNTIKLPANMLGEDKQFLKMTVGAGPFPETRNLLEHLAQ